MKKIILCTVLPLFFLFSCEDDSPETVTLDSSQPSEAFMADPGNGNPDLRLVRNVSMNGESFYKIAPSAEDKFTHVILWCASAGIPFGMATAIFRSTADHRET